MGFMDRAKQLADQAQAKLDEAQKQFQQQQQAQQQHGTGGPAPVEYDQHGRPIRPVGDPDGAGPLPPSAPLPTAHPADEAVGPLAATEPAFTPPPAEERRPPVPPSGPPAPPAPPSGAGGLTSGDPLAG